MTESEIFKMEVGYELNVLVATRVMGKKFPTVEEMRSEAQRQWRVQPECRHFLMGFDAWLEEGEFKWRYNVDAYSTDISHAWKAVEKMREQDYGFVIGNDDQDIVVQFIAPYNIGFYRDDKDLRVEAKTAPEAICKATLLALMKESEKE